MKPVNLLSLTQVSSPSSIFCYAVIPRFTPQPFCSLRRRTRSRTRTRTRRSRNKTSSDNLSLAIAKASPSDPTKLETVIDPHHLEALARFHVHRFVSLSKEAYSDLQHLITIDHDRKILISCRRSTLQFTGSVMLFTFVFGYLLINLFKLGLAFSGRFRPGSNNSVVVRRDRSLGGREVIVGKDTQLPIRKSAKLLGHPLSMGRNEMMRPTGVSGGAARSRVLGKKKLPKWWPIQMSSPLLTTNKDEYQREANRLIRALMDNRMGGKDIVEDDIIQLRRICRTSGVQVSIGTTNTRDSFYRASVDFVLNVCSSAPHYSASIQIDGEDLPQFIAGLAENMRFDSILAAKIVSAAVAARTRSYFLQAWALEMQDKHPEAMMELSKICLLLHIFPPEDSSPEMDMVARGLEKHLKIEQREFLMNMLVGICDEESCRIAAEALGLMLSSNGVVRQEN